jgi:pimeloyl-ACP methyl ester carboxylesterase
MIGGMGGAGGQGDGRRTLVLLHAFPVDSTMYDGVRATLERDVRLLTPNFRGFGGAPLGTEPPSLDVLADDVARLLDEQGVDRAAIGGTSMGGYVTMAFLRRHLDRVSALVLSNTKASADTDAARENRERIARTVESENSVREVHESVEPKLLGTTSTQSRPDVAAKLHEIVDRANPAAVAWAQRAMAARPDSFADLRRADVPALVLAGEEDELMSIEDAQAMLYALPRGELATLPTVGHLGAFEDPGAWASAVGAVLASS